MAQIPIPLARNLIGVLCTTAESVRPTLLYTDLSLTFNSVDPVLTKDQSAKGEELTLLR